MKKENDPFMTPARKEVGRLENAAWLTAAIFCFVGAIYFGITEGFTNGATYAILGGACLVFRYFIR